MSDKFSVWGKAIKSGSQNNRPLKTEQDVLLAFMEASIKRVNDCLCRVYTIESILVEKGLISKEELLGRVQEARRLPQTNVGRSILKEMLHGTDPIPLDKSTPCKDNEAFSRILGMINLDDAQSSK